VTAGSAATVRKVRYIIAILIVGAVAGCSSHANQRVTSMSIIVLPTHANLIRNGGFEHSGIDDWTLRPRPGLRTVLDSRVKFSGRRSLRLTAIGPGPVAPVVLTQEVVALPDSARGSRFLLTFRARTRRLSRSVQTELKLNYAGGGYKFFPGSSEDTTPGAFTARIPAGTSATWMKLVATAKASFPLHSIDAFVVDSGSGRLRGTVWVDNVELHSVE